MGRAGKYAGPFFRCLLGPRSNRMPETGPLTSPWSTEDCDPEDPEFHLRRLRRRWWGTGRTAGGWRPVLL